MRPVVSATNMDEESVWELQGARRLLSQLNRLYRTFM